MHRIRNFTINLLAIAVLASSEVGLAQEGMETQGGQPTPGSRSSIQD
ncbi:hypothetical protein [Pseudomonas sp. PLMAX]